MWPNKYWNSINGFQGYWRNLAAYPAASHFTTLCALSKESPFWGAILKRATLRVLHTVVFFVFCSLHSMKFIPFTCILLPSTLFILFTCTIRCVPNGYQQSITEGFCNATPTIHEIMNHNHFSEVFSSFSELHTRGMRSDSDSELSDMNWGTWIERHELRDMNCDSRFSLKTVLTQFSRSSLRIFELDTRRGWFNRLDPVQWTESFQEKQSRPAEDLRNFHYHLMSHLVINDLHACHAFHKPCW